MNKRNDTAGVNMKNSCPVGEILAIKDTMNVVNGKWKIPIIGSLLFGTKRFNEIQRIVSDINPRMLSKELKELELNGILMRKVTDTQPAVIEYELTESGKSFKQVIDIMVQWGMEHRKNSI